VNFSGCEGEWLTLPKGKNKLDYTHKTKITIGFVDYIDRQGIIQWQQWSLIRDHGGKNPGGIDYGR